MPRTERFSNRTLLAGERQITIQETGGHREDNNLKNHHLPAPPVLLRPRFKVILSRLQSQPLVSWRDNPEQIAYQRLSSLVSKIGEIIVLTAQDYREN